MFEQARFIDKMTTLERRHDEVSARLGLPEVISKRAEFLKLSREHAELEPLVTAWRGYRKLLDDLAQARQIVDAESDGEMRELARDEVRALEERREAIEQDIK